MASRFHDYSFANTMLIVAEAERRGITATRVAGYRRWQELGRQVRRGEKGIPILAPIVRKVRDPDPDRPCADTMEERRLVGFRVVHVFDVSQTEGDPLPDVTPRQLEGDVPNQWERLTALITDAGFTLGFDDPANLDGANGITHWDRRRVVLRDDLSGAQRFKTAAHELAHIRLHDPEGGSRPACRGVIEVEAESVAYIVCADAGIDTASYSLPYVATWANGNPAVVARTAQRVIGCVNTVLPALELDPHVELTRGDVARTPATLVLDRERADTPSRADAGPVSTIEIPAHGPVLTQGGGCATCGDEANHLVVYDGPAPVGRHGHAYNELACDTHAQRGQRGGAMVYPRSVIPTPSSLAPAARPNSRPPPQPRSCTVPPITTSSGSTTPMAKAPDGTSPNGASPPRPPNGSNSATPHPAGAPSPIGSAPTATPPTNSSPPGSPAEPAPDGSTTPCGAGSSSPSTTTKANPSDSPAGSSTATAPNTSTPPKPPCTARAGSSTPTTTPGPASSNRAMPWWSRATPTPSPPTKPASPTPSPPAAPPSPRNTSPLFAAPSTASPSPSTATKPAPTPPDASTTWRGGSTPTLTSASPPSQRGGTRPTSSPRAATPPYGRRWRTRPAGNPPRRPAPRHPAAGQPRGQVARPARHHRHRPRHRRPRTPRRRHQAHRGAPRLGHDRRREQPQLPPSPSPNHRPPRPRQPVARASALDRPVRTWKEEIREHETTPAITMTRSTGGDAPSIQLLTVEEVANILRTTPGAIYNQRHRGDAPGSLGIRVGRRILFHVRNLEAFLAQEGAAQSAARRD